MYPNNHVGIGTAGRLMISIVGSLAVHGIGVIGSR